jgi:hypothetical protein
LNANNEDPAFVHGDNYSTYLKPVHLYNLFFKTFIDAKQNREVPAIKGFFSHPHQARITEISVLSKHSIIEVNLNWM